MKRTAIVFALAALLCSVGVLPARSQTVGAPTEGKVSQEGKPLPNVQVVLTSTDTGKAYKTKTDKGGNFAVLGVPYGNYQVDVIGDKGEKLFTEKTSLGTGNTSATNVLNIDIVAGGAAPDNKFG